MQLALNKRNSTTIGVSPFLLNYSYPLWTIDSLIDVVAPIRLRLPIQKGEAIIAKIKAITE